jgi:hypothetical protein
MVCGGSLHVCCCPQRRSLYHSGYYFVLLCAVSVRLFSVFRCVSSVYLRPLCVGCLSVCLLAGWLAGWLPVRPSACPLFVCAWQRHRAMEAFARQGGPRPPPAAAAAAKNGNSNGINSHQGQNQNQNHNHQHVHQHQRHQHQHPHQHQHQPNQRMGGSGANSDERRRGVRGHRPAARPSVPWITPEPQNGPKQQQRRQRQRQQQGLHAPPGVRGNIDAVASEEKSQRAARQAARVASRAALMQLKAQAKVWVCPREARTCVCVGEGGGGACMHACVRVSTRACVS